jgi:chemotaxis protein methyltransferase CheR
MKLQEFASTAISAEEYEEFATFLRLQCGIDLGANKEYLVATRVRRILSDQNVGTIGELLALIRADSQKPLRQAVIDAMTTNETLWFRDQYPFQHLAHALKHLAGTHSHIRIWSAACSSGQEPYSISMVIKSLMIQGELPKSLNIDIVATDISNQILDVAKTGIYDAMALQRGLPAAMIDQYFTRLGIDAWQIKPEIRQSVTFKAFNLQHTFSGMGTFDIIFCRNVLIYFSMELKQDILRKLHTCLNPASLIFLGASESVTGLHHLFEMVHCNPGVAYQKK